MTSYTTDAARWRALATRDPMSNGHFLYTVKSTNIYCRPICPGRLARRANVGFCKTALEAEAAGFRACKRCKPNVTEDNPQDKAVEKACRLIGTAIKKKDSKALRLHHLAKNVCLTPRYFHKIFKDKTGMTPKDYASMRAVEETRTSVASGSIKSVSSVQTPDYRIFDFNTLIDSSIDPDLAFVDDLIAEASLASTSSFATDAGMNNLLHIGYPDYELSEMDSNFLFPNSKFLGSLEATLAPFALEREVEVPAVSTFELDAAILLGADGGTDLLFT